MSGVAELDTLEFEMIIRRVLSFFLLAWTSLMTTDCLLVRVDCADTDPACNDLAAAVIAAQFLPTTISSPDQIDGLALWLNAESITGSADMASVSAWTDSSTNGLVASAGTAPVYRTSQINGLPALEFDGTSQYLEIPFSASLNTANFTLFLVLSWTGTTPDGSFDSPITSRDSTTSPLVTQGYIVYADDADLWSTWLGRDTVIWSTNDAIDTITNDWTILAVRIDNSANPSVSFSANGTVQSARTVSFSPNLQRPLRIGAGVTEAAANFFFTGLIAEVIFYGAALSDSERLGVECYLSSRYAVTVTGCN